MERETWKLLVRAARSADRRAPRLGRRKGILRSANRQDALVGSHARRANVTDVRPQGLLWMVSSVATPLGIPVLATSSDGPGPGHA